MNNSRIKGKWPWYVGKRACFEVPVDAVDKNNNSDAPLGSGACLFWWQLLRGAWRQTWTISWLQNDPDLLFLWAWRAGKRVTFNIVAANSSAAFAWITMERFWLFFFCFRDLSNVIRPDQKSERDFHYCVNGGSDVQFHVTTPTPSVNTVETYCGHVLKYWKTSIQKTLQSSLSRKAGINSTFWVEIYTVASKPAAVFMWLLQLWRVTFKLTCHTRKS